ncbi:MAG: triose-phosphate isomerase [Patescibacteria group bacterium]
MSKTKRLVIANWKMNPQTPDEAKAILAGTRKATESLKYTEVIVCPSFLYFPAAVKSITSKVRAKMRVGVQDIFWEDRGSFTGEVSAAMVKAGGGTHVIVGHSERRALGETDEMVGKKVAAVVREDLTAILCIGEGERDVNGNYLSFLKQQLSAGLSGVQKRHVGQIVVAYEPVWAIGKSEREALTGSGMHEMTIFIRKLLSDIYGRDIAVQVPILYGGSVTPANAGDIVSEGHTDGLLVGRQSLDPAQFVEILKIVDSIS